MSQLQTNDANTGGETRRAVALSEPEAKPLVFAVDDEPMLLELATMCGLFATPAPRCAPFHWPTRAPR